MWIVFLGPPGSGKGTQTEYFVSEQGYSAISTGDLLRAAKNKVIDESTGQTIGDIIGGGALLPDRITINLIKEEVENLGDVNVIFDGFPRTIAQAEALNEMALQCGKKIDKVVNFVIDDDIIVKRIVGRFKCASCGKIYNRFFLETSVSGVCDVCHGTNFEHRTDDNEDALRKRLIEYHEKTHPLIDFYSKSGILYNVNADSSFEKVIGSVVEILNV